MRISFPHKLLGAPQKRLRPCLQRIRITDSAKRFRVRREMGVSARNGVKGGFGWFSTHNEQHCLDFIGGKKAKGNIGTIQGTLSRRIRLDSPREPSRESSARDYLNAGHAKSGREMTRVFDVSIGTVDLDFQLEDRRLLDAVRKRYAAFAGPAKGALSARVTSERSTNGEHPEFSGELDSARVDATTRSVRFSGVTSEFALDSLLRMYLSWALLCRDGFLLHAASATRDGRAYVFAGKSGAGKSTVASLSRRDRVLTDEISLLRRENGVWRAYGTPFWGEFRADGSNTSAPVAGIFLLVKADRNRIRPLRRAELLRALLQNVLFFSRKLEDQKRLLEIAGGASEEIPGFTLEFRKERKFWEVIP